MSESELQRVVAFVEARIPVVTGFSSDGAQFSSLSELWASQLADAKSPDASDSTEIKWYADALAYWEDEENCPDTDDGVLGGFGELSFPDVKGSNQFLDELQAKIGLRFGTAADCGAGIGRVSKYLLLPRFERVTLVEQSPRLLRAAPGYIGREDSKRAECLCLGLQDFAPAEGSFDVIWVQWVIGHLHDADLVFFFNRCMAGLRPGGVVVLKDNMCESTTFQVDSADSSVTRSREYFQAIFDYCGLTVVHERLQTDFPEDLYDVHMIALQRRPAEPSTGPESKS